MAIEPFLNRWRGTGTLISFFTLVIDWKFFVWVYNKAKKTNVSSFDYEVKLTGTMVYAIYIGLLFGLISTWYIGLISVLLFLGAESKGFGKWVGALITDEKYDLEKEYADDEGVKFPYFHQIANFIVNERCNFYWYCNVALFLRGLYWGAILYLALTLFGYISIVEYVILSVAYGIGFPLACWLSTKKSFNYKSKFISIATRWETQEVYYGVVQGIAIWYVVLQIIFKG